MMGMILMIGLTVLFFRVLGMFFRMGLGAIAWMFSGSGLLTVLVLALFCGGSFRDILPVLFLIGMLHTLFRSVLWVR